MEDLVLKEKEGPIGFVTLNRPDDMNTFTVPFANQLVKALSDLENDPEVKVVVVGHTHVPTLGQASWEEKPRQWKWKADQDEAQAFNQPDPLPLQNLENEPAILCPGSVGQPRLAGEDTRAAYAILDLERWAVWFRRVAYEERETEAAMVPMPARLIEIILEG